MKFLIDQDVYAATVRLLISLGHDVVTVKQKGLSQAHDEELIRLAQEQQRIFVTRDRDFGSLVFVKAIRTGVLYLRMLPFVQSAVHRELERLLTAYPEDDLLRSFIVIEADGYRIRRLPER